VGAAVLADSTALRAAAVTGVAALLLLAGIASLLGGLTGCDAGGDASPSASASHTIPADYLALYRSAGRVFRVPWTVLAAIGAIESDHGRSGAPGVHSGVNAFGCCAGPMQINVHDGPPSTWQRYRLDGDGDGARDPYDPADAIATAAHYPQVLLAAARGRLAQAVFGYNHSSAYVADVLARARAFSRRPLDELAGPANVGAGADCAAPAGPASLQAAERLTSPRAYTRLPAWTMAGGRAPELIDARLLPDALWLLRRYRLRVTAAREPGHHTHGDGTALDLVPASPTDQAAWDASTGALAHDLGWTLACAASGSRPVCRLVAAIQFIGYDGYPGHGSPRTCNGSCHAHIHVSWVSPCFGSSALVAPCQWVAAFRIEAGPAPR
jgi:hypothetical protein